MKNNESLFERVMWMVVIVITDVLRNTSYNALYYILNRLSAENLTNNATAKDTM